MCSCSPQARSWVIIPVSGLKTPTYTGKEGGESRCVREKRNVGVALGDDGKAEEGPQWRSGLEGKQAESQLQGHWNQL